MSKVVAFAVALMVEAKNLKVEITTKLNVKHSINYNDYKIDESRSIITIKKDNKIIIIALEDISSIEIFN